MRKIWATTNWPAEAADITAANAAGASEIVSLPCPSLPALTAGYNAVAEPGDPPTDLVGAQAFQLAALATQKQAALQGMAYDGYQVTLSSQDQIDIMGALQQLQGAAAGATLQWEIVNGTFVVFALADVEALYTAGITHIQGCYTVASTLTAAIKAATDVAAVYAVDIIAGWPN